MLFLVLLAAFVPWAQAVSATGGTMTYYIAGGTNFAVHTFTTVGSNSFNVTAGGGSFTTIPVDPFLQLDLGLLPEHGLQYSLQQLRDSGAFLVPAGYRVQSAIEGWGRGNG